MPYISKSERPKYEDAINEILAALPEDHDRAVGELNYVISSIVARRLRRMALVEEGRLRYYHVNHYVTGTVGHAYHELLRRFADPLEDDAIKRNGDI